MAILKTNEQIIQIGLGLASAYRVALSLARDTGLSVLVEFNGQRIVNVAPNSNELWFNSTYERLFGSV